MLKRIENCERVKEAELSPGVSLPAGLFHRHGASIIGNTIQISAAARLRGAARDNGPRFSPCPHYQKTRSVPANQWKRLRR